MNSRGDTDKGMWVTEIGWNSSQGSPTRPVCVEPVLVTEEEQAAFLTSSFDILLNEGIEKIFLVPVYGCGNVYSLHILDK